MTKLLTEQLNKIVSEDEEYDLANGIFYRRHRGGCERERRNVRVRTLFDIDRGRRGLSPDDLLEKLIQDVFLYVGKVEQHDDLTAVVVKVDT